MNTYKVTRISYNELTPFSLEKMEQLRAEGKQGFKTGEGFRKWTPEEIQAANSGLNEYLIRMLYNK